MKITKLKIEEFQQFRNLDLDFTYPEGHEKAGEPLDKVCFIGQSGVGKTSLLLVLQYCIDNLRNRDIFTDDNIYLDDFGLSYTVQNAKSIFNDNPNLIYFTSEIQANVPMLSMPKIKDEPKKIIGVSRPESPRPTLNEKHIIFSDFFDENVWRYLLWDIEHHEKLFKKASKKLALELSVNANEAIKKFKDWNIKIASPLMKIANECLDPAISDFNLKVNPESTENIYFPIQHIDGTEIPPHKLSTGTKQIILTALPIYLFDTKDTIILFDEPERSLFPDIQLKIVDYYTRLAPEAQFFFATHSPMVAAAFEPCERFILRFDEDGYVTSDSVYKGDSPIGDDPNDILYRDFGIRHIINEHGIQQWEHYLNLQNKLSTEKDEEKKKKLILEVVKLGNRYNYPA